MARNTGNRMTVGVLASGGAICTMAAIRAGWRPIWGTEIDAAQQKLWEDLTGAKCLGDTFTADYSAEETPVLLTSGQPCPDYTLPGSKDGSKGKTGWMFVKQVEVILAIRPLMFRLEMTNNAVNINGGEDVKSVIRQLQVQYNVQQDTLRVWDYGDPSFRARIFIIGFRHDMGEYAKLFQWPRIEYDQDWSHCARDVAVPDDKVPSEYWIQASDDDKRLHYTEPKAGELHKLASTGVGIGPAECPHKTHGWDGTHNTQTTLNGGARRPALNWTITTDGAIGMTRLTVPIEAVRIASVTHEYLEYIKQFGGSDRFLFTSINNGIPMRTCTAIDTQLMRVAEMWFNKPKNAHLAWGLSQRLTGEATEFNRDIRHTRQAASATNKRKRSAAIDSGANISLFYNDIEDQLRNKKKSNTRINIANDDYMDGAFEGDLIMTVGSNGGKRHTRKMMVGVTTASQLSRELFSIDHGYQHDNLNVLLVQPNFSVTCTNCGYDNELGGPQMRYGNEKEVIPLRYNYCEGGFWLDYDISCDNHAGYKCKWRANSIEEVKTAPEYEPCFNRQQTMMIADRCYAHSGVTEIVVAQHPDDREFRGVKSGLRHKKQMLTAKQFHELFGHLGSCPGCLLCIDVKGCMRRIYKIIDKHRELRPAHTWVLDTVTWSHRSRCGCKYMAVMRDMASSAIYVFCLFVKNEIREQLAAWITKLRSRPEFQGLSYQPMANIITDNAGEWDMKCEAWDKLETEYAFQTTWTSPDSKKENAKAERTCGIVEVVTKALLMQNNLPRTWWVYCAEQASWLLNRFPVSSLDVSVPVDGDRVRPLERLTQFYYSRRQIDRELSYFIPVGTLCLVHDTSVKGSSLNPKTKWGIAIKMYREQTVFMSPYNGATFKSKSATAVKFRPGMNAWQFLNLPIPSNIMRSSALQRDFDEKIVIELPQWKPLSPGMAGLEPAVESVTFSHDNGDHENKLTMPKVTTKANQNLGGSVIVKDSHGKILDIDKETGVMLSAPTELVTAEEILNSDLIGAADQSQQKQTKLQPIGAEICNGDDLVVDCRLDDLMTKFCDQHDAKEVEHLAITTSSKLTFVKVCKQHGLSANKHTLYKNWLLQTNQLNAQGRPFKASDFKFKRNFYLPEGTIMPKPSGSIWRRMCKIGSNKFQKSKSDEIEELIKQAEQEVLSEVKEQTDGKPFNFALSAATICCYDEFEFEQLSKTAQATATKNAAIACAARKKKRVKAVGTKEGNAPSNIKAALGSEHREQWAESIGNEVNGLTDMGVLSHKHSKADLHKRGITSKPVQLGLYFDYKYDENGNVVRFKTRAAVQGHKGSMFKGVHFFETFAATPREDTERILQALMVMRNLKRRSCDVEKAYCWAKLAEDQKIALRYPKGLEQFDDDGNELFMVMEANLYGAPNAGRNWSIHRDETLLAEFNKGDWTCVKAEMDPCLFHFTLHNSETDSMEECWAVIHTDDIDAVSTHDNIVDKIFKRLNEIWKIKVVDSGYILGVKRTLQHDDNGKIKSVDVTMPAFIQGMADAFKDHIPEASIDIPFPDKMRLDKKDAIDDKEVEEVKALGYQRAIGMILWAARHVFPESKHGCSQCCSVMAVPSRRAFKGAMHMIAYMVQRKDRGIKFTAQGNQAPVCMSDASNKGDEDDGLSYHGWVIMWAGGPIASASKKLTMVGTSSEHNE